jgi:hypothetical protein
VSAKNATLAEIIEKSVAGIEIGATEVTEGIEEIEEETDAEKMTVDEAATAATLMRIEDEGVMVEVEIDVAVPRLLCQRRRSQHQI